MAIEGLERYEMIGISPVVVNYLKLIMDFVIITMRCSEDSTKTFLPSHRAGMKEGRKVIYF